MVFWPIHGITKRLTERRRYSSPVPVRTLGRQFRRSMHLFVIDSGCDNMLNLHIAALQAPQYNTHRFGLYFADTPRHADLLVILGPPLPSLYDAVRATLRQMPEPFGVLLVGGETVASDSAVAGTNPAQLPGQWGRLIEAGRVAGYLPGLPSPGQILGTLLAIQRGGRS